MDGRSSGGRWWRAVVGASGAAVALVAMASPAAAHGGAVKPTDDQAEIVSVSPELPGLRVRLIDAGTRFELDAGPHRVFVLGYDGEDYLRIDGRGVFQNVRSPATFLNTSINGSSLPGSVDPTAPAVWEKVSDGRVARWHDHSLHVPKGLPAKGGVVTRFERELLVDDQPGAIDGRIVRLPARSPAPWFAIASVLAVAVVLLARRAWRATIVAGLVVLVLANVARAFGVMGFQPAWLVSRIQLARDNVPMVVIGAGMAVCAVVLLRRDRRLEAATAAAMAALVMTLDGGLLDVRDLSRALLATSLPDGAARASVAVALGVGVGVFVAAVREIRRVTSRPARRGSRSGSAPTRADGTRTASPSAPTSG